MDTLGVRRGNEDILFRASTNGGARFADAINLSNTPARSWRGDIEASGNGVHVAWIDEVGGDKDILLRTSGDQGARFSPAVNLSDNGRDSTNPSVSAAGRYIYVAWQQRTSGHYTIRLRWSNDTGGAFGEGVEISNFGTRGSSHAPTVIGIGNHVYAAWQDHGLGAMYRKGARSETRAIPGLILRDGIKDR